VKFESTMVASSSNGPACDWHCSGSGGEMQANSLEKRVEVLENTLLGPDGITAQLTGLRSDTAALQASVTELRRDVALRTDLEELRRDVATRTDLEELRRAMVPRAEFDSLRGDVASVRVDLDALRGELHVETGTLRAAIEQTNIHMRVLHEEVLERLARIGERWPTATSRPSRTRKKR
jgi:multidrug resistance efflux pump